MIIFTTNKDKVYEPGFSDFSSFDDGDASLRIISDYNEMIEYAVSHQNRIKEVEDILIKSFVDIRNKHEKTDDDVKWHANYLYHYASLVVKSRWEEAEQYIMEIPYVAYSYAYDIVNGRWPEAEKYLIRSPKYAYYYARYVIRDRWPEAESYIVNDALMSVWYAIRVLKARWHFAEPYIMTDANAAVIYATDLLKCRWDEAEDFILQSSYGKAYADHFQVENMDFSTTKQRSIRWGRRDKE